MKATELVISSIDNLGIVSINYFGKVRKRKLVNDRLKFNGVRYWVYGFDSSTGQYKVVEDSRFYILDCKDTNDWDTEFLFKNKIVETHTVYLFDSSVVTCLCSPVPNYNMIPCYGFCVLSDELYDDCNECDKESSLSLFDSEWAKSNDDIRESGMYWECKSVFAYNLIPFDNDDDDDLRGVIESVIESCPIC